MAKIFAQEGAAVVLTDIDSASGTKVAKEDEHHLVFMEHDVSKSAHWENVIGSTLERFGRIDVLVNNAAVYDWVPLQETDEALLDKMWHVNAMGVFLGMRAVVPPMQRQGGGSIINISSVGGMGGYPGIFAYATTKWAIRGMTKCAARDLGPLGIRVNTILPGVIDTQMIAHLPAETKEGWRASMPLGRIGEPKDVAQVALFLASDASAYMTGSDLVVDAGMVA